MTKRFLASVVVAAVTVAGLASCSTPDRGYVQREWSETFRELGIVPIFPPREDFVVGDLYAYDFDPDSLETERIFNKRFETLTPDEQALRVKIGMSPRLHRVNLTGDALREYESTPAFPQTDSPDLIGGTVDWTEGLKAAVARVEKASTQLGDAGYELAEAQKNADTNTKAIETTQAELAKLPAGDPKREALEKKLKDLQGEKPGIDRELSIKKQVRASREKELAAAEKARELVEKSLREPAKRFVQPRYKKTNTFTGEPTVVRGNENSAKHDRTNRLRLAAFPDFSSTTFTQGELSALIPIEALLLGVNANFSNLKRVSVRIPAAEVYGLPISSIVDSVTCDSDGSGRRKLVCAARDALRFAFPGGERKFAYVRVPTEIYYARAMDVSIFTGSAGGARLTLASTPEKKTDPITNPKPGPDGGLPGDLSAADANDLLTRAREQLNQVQPAPGGSVQIVSASEFAVGVRRTYDRPVAIGFRGITLKVNIQTGEIENVSLPGTEIPTLDWNQSRE